MSANQERGSHLLKGAIVAKSADGADPVTIAFQYSPHTLRRTLTPRTVGGEPHDRSESVRFTGAPIEVISLDIHIDAVDALDAGEQLAVPSGIAPALAALASWAHPSSKGVIQRRQLLESDTLETAPAVAPSVQFVLSPQRVLPVRLQNVQVAEEALDANLNPIRATVTLTMLVLTYSEVSAAEPAYADFRSYQQSLETLAARLDGAPPN